MPSGAKKRKAAKKKKENKASSTSDAPTSPASSTTTHSLGDEDLKHHESDGDHNSEQHLTEGEEEVVEKREEGSSRLEGNKTIGDAEEKSERVEKRVPEGESVVQIERELKPDDEFGNQKGGLSSGSRSSSDDESHAVEKDIVVVDNAPVVGIVEAVDSLSEGPSQVTCATPVIKVNNSVQEAAADFGVEKVSLPDLKAPTDFGASADNSLTPVVVESEVRENGERKSSSCEESTTLVEVVKDLVPQHKNDEVINAAAASDTKESAAGESQDKLMQAHNVPRDNVIKDGAHMKDSEVPGSSDGQPFVASAPQPVQTTSWKSCCGLFEVFTGSNR